jgi:hypothetical protein
MNNETKSKMDALFAAMNQQKPQVKTNPKQEQPRTFESLPEIEKAAKSGEVINLSNLAELVNKDKAKDARPEIKFQIEEISVQGYSSEPTEEEREIEQIDISGLFSESVPPTIEAPKQDEKPCLTIIDYSPKAFAIIGDTKAFKLRLRDLGGRFNPFLTCGAGWIFPKTKQAQVLSSLGI